MTTITEELLTRKDVAKLFQVSTLTIIRLEAAGKLSAVRLGAGTVRYRKSDIERFIANHRCSSKL
jgi:excisionase family DNA binding protein